MRRHPLSLLAIASCGLTLTLPTGLRADTPHARFETVQLLPVRVEAEPVAGTPARADEEPCLRHLAEAATIRAERSLLHQGIAAHVARGETREGAVKVMGLVRLPVSLPPGTRGKGLEFRHGRFATAEVTLARPDGTVLARTEETLGWGDVRWSVGARHAVARRVDDVLTNFVEKSMDLAVKRLRARLGGTDSASVH